MSSPLYGDKDGLLFPCCSQVSIRWLSDQSGASAEGPSDILDVEAVASIVRCPKYVILVKNTVLFFNTMILFVET